MTPKEKAIKLKDMYLDSLPQWVNNEDAKLCALIAVDEILMVCSKEIINCSDKTYFYWEEVRKEIVNL